MLLAAILLASGFIAEPPPAQRNTHPIVLVGGFTVWGREEGLGFKYWGGRRDIQEDLKTQGHSVFTAAPGPFASNWDRACEVFAMLKGGRVDYGKAHAAVHGHARLGRMGSALLPDWGATTPKIHLVGHSMGGQTARVLVQLLTQGDEAERKATPPEELSPLFQGGHAWVASVTSLATPHQGTTLTWRQEGLVGPAQKLFALAASLGKPKRDPFYDVKLEHWGLTRQKEESHRGFLGRVFSSPLWNGTRDFSVHELSPEGAAELNTWVRTHPNVYYFSWSTEKTHPDARGHQVPSHRMTPLWYLGSRFMGRTVSVPGHKALDGTWFRNDGVVNTRSMAGPGGDLIRLFEGTPHRGEWNHMGVLKDWDHTEIIGIGPDHGDEVLAFYRRWAEFLAGLQD